MFIPRNQLILVLQSFGIWLLFLVMAILKGGIREHYLEEHVSLLAAHQLSTLLLCIEIFTITAIFVYTRRINGYRTLLAIGLFWACLTVIFELSFFHFVARKPLGELLADYNILDGRLFSLVIMTALVSPVIAGRLIAGRDTE